MRFFKWFLPITVFVISTICLVSFLVYVDQEDRILYAQLVAESSPTSISIPENMSQVQEREKISKFVAFSEGYSRKTFKIISDASEVNYLNERGDQHFIENMHQVKCFLQEDLYYVTPEGKEVARDSSGTFHFRETKENRGNDLNDSLNMKENLIDLSLAKGKKREFSSGKEVEGQAYQGLSYKEDQHNLTHNSEGGIDLNQLLAPILAPRHKVRCFTTDHATYYYKQDFLIAHSVAFYKYTLNTHDFIQDFDSYIPSIEAFAKTFQSHLLKNRSLFEVDRIKFNISEPSIYFKNSLF